MAKKPSNFQWIGFDEEQLELLDFIDFVGNNGWSRNSRTDALMTGVLDDCAAAGLSFSRLRSAMRAIGYGPQALHQLARRELKRTSGRFGRQLHPRSV